MNTTSRTFDEARLAAEIVSVLQPAALRACSDERDVIRYCVRGNSLKLRTIILDRQALRRLLDSRDGAVKIEYLKRDLLRTATQRIEYRYPRHSVTNRRQSGNLTVEAMVKSQRA
jgi:hypothetical protein